MASGRKEAWEEGKATGTLLTGVDETHRRRRGRKTCPVRTLVSGNTERFSKFLSAKERG